MPHVPLPIGACPPPRATLRRGRPPRAGGRILRARPPAPGRAPGFTAPRAVRAPARARALLLACVSLLALSSPARAALRPAAPDTSESRVRAALAAGRFAAAESLARARSAAAARRDGPRSPAAAEALDALVKTLVRVGRATSPAAAALADSAVGLRERVPGRDSLDLGRSLANLAAVSFSTGAYREAIAQAERARRLLERGGEAQGRRVAAALNAEGSARWALSDYDAARRALERAVAIQERAGGPDDPDLAGCLQRLGLVLHSTSDYEGSRAAYLRALAIRERAQGAAHPDLAGTLTMYAALLYATREHVERFAALQRALTILESALGPEHPRLIGVLNNLGAYHADFGDHEDARRFLERALRLRIAASGPSHPLVGMLVNNLASVAEAEGQFARAESLYRRAYEIHLEARGPESWDVAQGLLSLGSVRRATGRAAEAKADVERAVRILEAVIGPEQHDTADALESLGSCHLALGETRAAQEVFERARGIRERRLGPRHPDLAWLLGQLAGLAAAQGRREDALALALRSESIRTEHLRRTCRGLSEREALSYASAPTGALDVALALAAGPAADDGTRRAALDAVIRARALVLDEMAWRSRILAMGRAEEARPLIEAWRRAQQALAAEAVRGAEDEGPEAFATHLDSLRRAADEAEARALSATGAARPGAVRGDAGLEEVLASLPAGSALVSYARSPGPPAMDYAFVLRPGARAPFAVALGRASRTDSLVAAWREQAGRDPRGIGAALRESACRQAGEALAAAVWRPLGQAVRGARRVFVVPDGSLSLVPLAALPAEGGRYVVELGPVLHVLGAERDLVPAREVTAGERLLALGDPDFDARGALEDGAPPAAAAGARRGSQAACDALSERRWSRLPATAGEVEAVLRAWTAPHPSGAPAERLGRSLTGAAASEAALKREAPGARVLHFATHGFVTGGDCPTALVRNPLLRAGLVLAGANRRDAGPAAAEDGVLTAEEVAGMELHGAEWAVLSACETGVGDPRAGEGVLGLQRAFRIAGARTVVMSLWAVDDEAASAWMTALYRARWERGLDTAASVAEASRGALRGLRARGATTHPFLWAAFVAAGEWR